MNELTLPVFPAPRGSQSFKPGEALRDQNFCVTLLGILLLRCEEKVLYFSQADFDAISGLHVLEGMNIETGEFLLTIGYPGETNG